MKQEEFDTLWERLPSRSRDALVSVNVMGWRPKGLHLVPAELVGELLDHHQIPDLPLFSTDIAAAWQVFENRCGQLFSRRRAFLECLGELLTKHPDLSPGTRVAWPDAIQFLTPELICKAALLSVEGGGA